MTRADKDFMAVMELITLKKAKICCEVADLLKIDEIFTEMLA